MFAALREIVPQDAREFLVDETARLAEECARQLSQRGSKDRGGLVKDIRSVFSPLPQNALPESRRNGHGMKWIAAGPSFLTGVKPLRYHVDDSVEDMRNLFYKSKGLLPVDRRTELGIHGHSHLWNFKTHAAYGRQHVYELQRLVVKRKVYSDFVRQLKQRYGRLEASFAKTAQILRGGSAKVKAYISRHLNGEPLPNITELAGLSTANFPKMQFGSSAPGVVEFEPYIQDAIEVRVNKMEQRAKLILSHYARDVADSIAPRRAAKRTENASA
jgi:hypothetical protein